MIKKLLYTAIFILFSLNVYGLDLREANIVNVTYDGDIFAVTLYHDDDGEDGYADFWQVETLQGDLLGKLEMTHAHSTEPFVRTQPIDIPTHIEHVVVVGHDSTHGFGGQAAVYNIISNEVQYVDQGEDKMDFGDFITEEPIEEVEETILIEMPDEEYEEPEVYHDVSTAIETEVKEEGVSTWVLALRVFLVIIMFYILFR